MPSHFDTIVAPITGTEPAAVAVIRVSGPEAWQVATRVFEKWPATPESHRAQYGRFTTGDDGLVLPFADGHSYTGEQAVELSIHGSPASVEALVNACIDNGARFAEPGEFTMRAFLNGRMDLTQAEGVRDTVEARTADQLRQANLLREGALTRAVEDIRATLLTMLTAVEASVDFSEEIGEFQREGAVESVNEAVRRIDLLLETADSGRLLRQGYRIAIVGLPNAGKSSLLNALLNYDRAIVTDVPGTTRDFVEEEVDLGGVRCILIDTAGIHDTEDLVEELGIGKAFRVAASADEIWFLHDCTTKWTEEEQELLMSFDRPTLVVGTKCDIGAVPVDASILISSVTREGLPRLIEHVKNKVRSNSGLPVINSRHAVALSEAKEVLLSLREGLQAHTPDDLLTVELAQAIRCLGEITGETATPDVIDRIFHDFCIGK